MGVGEKTLFGGRGLSLSPKQETQNVGHKSRPFSPPRSHSPILATPPAHQPTTLATKGPPLLPRTKRKKQRNITQRLTRTPTVGGGIQPEHFHRPLPLPFISQRVRVADGGDRPNPVTGPRTPPPKKNHPEGRGRRPPWGKGMGSGRREED